jgi:deoxyribose-phosphate aldolase
MCTGKEAKNATLFHGMVMCQAIKHYHEKTSYKVDNMLIIIFSQI